MRTRLVLAAILLLALGLRLFGLRYGLPAVYNPDEVAIMNRALAFGTGDLNPHNFLYPTLYFYALFAWEGLWFVTSWITGAFDSLAAFQRQFFVDPTGHYLAGRVLSVLCGVATVGAVYRLATRLEDRPTGLIAAAFLAVAPFAVRDAHYVKHDVPVTLLVVLTMVALVRAMHTPPDARALRGWLVAGGLAGLAMSTHYYAVFLALPVGLAAILPPGPTRPWRERVRALITAGTAATLVFVLASPFLLLELPTAWRDIVGNREIVMDRAVEGSGAFASLDDYARMLFSEATGFPVALFAALGAAALLRRNWRTGVIVLAFPIAFILFISNTVPASRYLNVVLPFMAVAAAVPVRSLVAREPARKALLLATLTFLMMSPGLRHSGRIGEFFRQTDTRTLALEYFDANVPEGATVLIQPYSVPLRQSRAGLVEALRTTLRSEERASIKFQRLLRLDPYPAPSYRTIFLGTGGEDVDKIYVPQAALTDQTGLAPLRALGVQYVVLKRYNEPDPALMSLDRALAREGRLVAAFSPYRRDLDDAERTAVEPFLHNTDARIDRALQRPGPAIEIWRID